MLDWFPTDPFGILVIFYDKLDSQPECALGRCLLPICLFLFGSRGLFQGGLIIAPVAVRRCFRRNALQGESVNATCDGGRQRSLPVSNRHTKSSFFFCCSAGFLFVSCLGCPGASQRHNIAPLVFQAQPTAARPAKHPFVSVCSSSLFSLFIMVLLPQAFMFSYKPPPSTPNYPPFSPHESDFVDTPRTSPSQVNNFGCGVGLGAPSRWSNMWHSVWGFLLSVALRVREVYTPKVCLPLAINVIRQASSVGLVLSALTSHLGAMWIFFSFFSGDCWRSHLMEDIPVQRHKFGQIHQTGSCCDNVKWERLCTKLLCVNK